MSKVLPIQRIQVETNKGKTTLTLWEMFGGTLQYHDSNKHLVSGRIEADGVHLRGSPGIELIRVVKSDAKVASMTNGRKLFLFEGQYV